ncbi:MAG: acyltransferase [Thermodesulfobacteriota bacterium]|nr:acyltransferase [Thermodesulfobacteriota bacterium]
MGSIRLFLASIVLISHATPLEISLLPGHVAVQVFFIISGFYMSLILSEKYKTDTMLFYTNRLFRLFPTYLLVLVLSFTALLSFDVAAFTHMDRFENVFSHGPVMAGTYVWTNIAVLGQEMLFLLGVDTANYSFFWAVDGAASAKAWSYILVPQAWSLSLELCFYFLAPLVLRRGVYWVGGVFLLSLALRLFLVLKGPQYDLLLRRCLPAELCLFLLGYFSYLLFLTIKGRSGGYVGLLSWAVLLAVLLSFDSMTEGYALTILALTTCLCIPFIFNATKDNRLDRFLGNISYPFYIVHFLIVAFFDEYFEEYPLFPLLATVWGASLILYYVVDEPIDRWRQRRVVHVAPKELPRDEAGI